MHAKNHRETIYSAGSAQTSKSDHSQISGVFSTFDTLRMQKSTIYLSLEIEILITKFTRRFYSVSSNCPPFALTQALRRLWKLTTDFLITSCGSSSHIINDLFAKQTIISMIK